MFSNTGRNSETVIRINIGKKGSIKMNNTTVDRTEGRNKTPELKQLMNVEEIRFGRIYTVALPLEENVYAYVRDWKNGKVGYSVLDEATDHPDFSDCGVFWMDPEDFAKIFVVYREMSSDDPDDEREKREAAANKESIFEFRERVKKEVLDIVSEDVKAGLTLENVEIVKINDQKLYGLTFHIGGACSAPTFYLNDMYEHYIHGMPADTMAIQLVNSFMCSVPSMDEETEASLIHDEEADFDDIKDRIAIKVLERDRNKVFLKTVPHKNIDHGLAVVYDVQTLINGQDAWRMPVTKDILDKAGLSEDELFDTAMKNVNDVDPAVLMSLDMMNHGKKIKNLLENGKRLRKGKQLAYVLTNRCARYGAAAFFYPGIQKRIADTIGDSYYAVPTSIHEFMIVPEASGADIAGICRKLQYDNCSTAHQEDVFTDKVFHYDRKWDELMCINEMIGESGAQC